MNMLFISKKDDYSYIDKFIDYLERLINIIINLFKGLKEDKKEEEGSSSAE